MSEAKRSDFVPGLVLGGLAGAIVGFMVGAGAASSDAPAKAPVKTATLPAESFKPGELALSDEAKADHDALEERVRDANWTYDEDRDEMTDKVTKTACVTSENEARLSWPYTSVKARLCLRNSPRWGKDAYVSLMGDGQILCRSYDGCTVRVRFDKATPQAFSATGASDGSSNIVFFQNQPRLAAGLKGADKAIVEVEFYQAGVQQLRFDVHGLKW